MGTPMHWEPADSPPHPQVACRYLVALSNWQLVSAWYSPSKNRWFGYPHDNELEYQVTHWAQIEFPPV
jgi:hypothetical protein